MFSKTEGLSPNISIQKGAFLVYIAGVQVPASSISVNFSFMSFSTATITLPADKELLKLGEDDRVPVVIFFLDSWYSPTDPLNGIVPTWRMLFDGDITQWSYSRSAYSRAITFSVISHISVLNIMSIMYLSGDGKSSLDAKSNISVESMKVGRFSELQALSPFTKGAYGDAVIDRPMDFVKNLLLGMKIGGPPDTTPSEKDRIAKMNALDKELSEKSSSLVSGENYKELRRNEQKTSASSEFFIKYNHRNKIDKRWVASSIEDLTLVSSGSETSEPKDERETSLRSATEKGKPEVVQDAAFKAMIKRITFDAMKSGFTQTSSPQDSFWNLISKFYGQVLYNVIQLPTAQYVFVKEETDVPTDMSADSDSSYERLANCLSVPNMAFALSPSCNVFTPAMVNSFTFAEDYASQNTRTIVSGSFLDPASQHSAKSSAISARAMSFGYPSDQNRALEQETKTKRSAENLLIYPEEFFKGPVVSRPKAPAYFLTLEQSSLYRTKEAADKAIEKGVAALVADKSEPTSEEDKAVKVAMKEWRQELLYGYAKSYYLESKYSARSGSINLEFNPYVIPGMTFTMLDNADYDQFHLTGIVTGVNISMSNSNVSTTLSYTAGRTLKEVYEQVFIENTFGPDTGVLDPNDDLQTNKIFSTAPIMPITKLASTLQSDDYAAEFYKTLLYSNDAAPTAFRDYAFKHANYFEETSGEKIIDEATAAASQQSAPGKPKPEELSTVIKDKLRTKKFPGTITNVRQDTTKTQIAQMNVDLKVRADKADSLNDYELGMRRAARPICSIDEYMRMFNTSAEYALVSNTNSFQSPDEFGISYPLRIRLYEVDTEVLGDNFVRPYAKDRNSFTNASPELRRDWPSKLLAYRRRIKDNAILGR